MIVLNRNIEPELKAIDKIQMSEPTSFELSNGIPVHAIDMGSEELIKIEIVVRAGAKYTHNPLVASFTNQLMAEGTLTKNAAQLAEAFDQYGARFSTQTTNDYASFVLLTMNKYMSETLTLMAEVLSQPAFLSSEYETLVDNRKQIFLVNMQKVGSIAKNRFPLYLFGENHVYGNPLSTEHFDELNYAELKAFYTEYFHAQNMDIFLSGKIPTETKGLLDNLLGDKFVSNQAKSTITIQTQNNASENFIHHPNAMQNAFRWGMHTIHKGHEDFQALRIVNSLFGGYFGSRLMKNIREDKGYTYGIGSTIVSYEQSSYFVLGAEVGSDVSELAKAEILKEFDKLHNELTTQEELDLLKNFLQGSLLRGFDGPFASIARFKDVYLFGLDYSYYENYLQVLKAMTSNEIRDIANKYLSTDRLVKLIVGTNKI